MFVVVTVVVLPWAGVSWGCVGIWELVPEAPLEQGVSLGRMVLCYSVSQLGVPHGHSEPGVPQTKEMANACFLELRVL